MGWFPVVIVAFVAFSLIRGVRARRRSERFFTELDALPPAPRSDRRRRRERLERLWTVVEGLLSWSALIAFTLALIQSDLLPAPPGGLPRDWWGEQILRYFLFVAVARQIYGVWRLTQDRWAVAAFGPPRLRYPENDPNHDRSTPRRLAAPAPPPPRDWYDRIGEAIPIIALATLFFGSIAVGASPFERPTVILIFLFALLWAAGTSLRNWWRMPAGSDLWLTDVGLVQADSRFAWEEVERAAVAPIATGDGEDEDDSGLAIELVTDDRRERFLIASEAVGAWESLSAAIPETRIVRAEPSASAGVSTEAVPLEDGGLGVRSAPHAPSDSP